MLRSLKSLEGYGLHAIDGELGITKDFLFDDVRWNLRYAEVDTRRWLPGRRVLISPTSFGEPDWSSSLIPVDLTKDQVREAPSVEEDLPVSRQHEGDLAAHYAWPTYWVPLLGGGLPSRVHVQAHAAEDLQRRPTADGDPHLRSADEVRGYAVQATDGEVGTVADFVADSESWVVRYLVVDTRKWLPGGKVLVSPGWIEHVRWSERSVHVDLEVDAIKACPAFKRYDAVNREYEERIYDYYGRPRYWA